MARTLATHGSRRLANAFCCRNPCFSFKRLTAWLGLVQVPVEAEFDTLERPDALPIGWAVRTVAARTLWTSTCLVQALAGTQMLYRHKISASILGVAMASPDKSERIEAHAWLKQGSVFLTVREAIPDISLFRFSCPII